MILKIIVIFIVNMILLFGFKFEMSRLTIYLNGLFHDYNENIDKSNENIDKSNENIDVGKYGSSLTRR